MSVERSGTLIDSSVLFAPGATALRSVSGLGDNPKPRERKPSRPPRCNRWHTENASTTSSGNTLISLNAHPRKVPMSQCPSRENPKNTAQHRSLAFPRKNTHPLDQAWRCRISGSSCNSVSNLPFSGLPIGETDFSRFGKP